MSSYTQTTTWTITQARYVTGKIASDLELLRVHYQRPPAQDVSDFAEEAAQLLAKGYLESVEFGFKKNDQVIFCLKYVAQSNGTLSADDRPGRVPAGYDFAQADFYSYLTYSRAWFALSDAQRAEFKEGLPVQRTPGDVPTTGAGYWDNTRSYSAAGNGVTRQTFRPHG